jgi:hypothetical protein
MLNSSHQRLWWLSVNTSIDSSMKTEELAEKIVKDSLDKVQILKKTEARLR